MVKESVHCILVKLLQRVGDGGMSESEKTRDK